MPQNRTEEEVAELFRRYQHRGNVTRRALPQKPRCWGIDTGLLFTTANNTVRTSGSGEDHQRLGK